MAFFPVKCIVWVTTMGRDWPDPPVLTLSYPIVEANVGRHRSPFIIKSFPLAAHGVGQPIMSVAHGHVATC